MQLWSDYEEGIEDHVCVGQEFTSCEICERSWEARTQLGTRLTEIMRLLERYHGILANLADQVIQEVPLPRNEKLQMAMLKAVSMLDRS
jgi:hypothetical protein